MSTAVVTWPSTYGAATDYLIPENLASTSDVTQLIRNGSTPGLFESLEAATGNILLPPFAAREAGIPLDTMTSKFAAEIVRRHRPGLLLVHFLDFDHRQHFAGPGSPEACESLARIDSHVGRLVSAYSTAGILRQTTFFIVSDHGFLPVRDEVNVAAVLATSGWGETFPDGSLPDALLELRLNGGSIVFYPRSPKDGAIAAKLEERVRPQVVSNFAGLVRWLTPDELRAIGSSAGAAFALCAMPGHALVYVPSRPDVTQSPRSSMPGAHGYCPDEQGMDAIFIASGAGVAPRGRIARIRMVDVAPTIAGFLGLAMPDATGHSLADKFRKPAELSRRPQ
jgi:hypothetical protein